MENKMPCRAKKRKTAAKQQQTTDMFTCLCRSDLRVLCIKEYRFHSVRKWRFDYALPDYKIALEVEGGVWTGGRHTSPKGFLGDMEKYNTATILGWRVLRTTPDELCTRGTLTMLRETINNTNNALNGTNNDEKDKFCAQI
ncbi:MAG: endonuclease domain-containing protein [Bacteroidaceae bacterium]|nr:endonuclease domain-containing protein [Bacteroidaceae bacterium]